MQRAARSVALENHRLRALLTARGVSQHEITTYLSAPDTVRDVSEPRSDGTPPAWDPPRLESERTGGPAELETGPGKRAASSLSSKTIGHLPSPLTTAAPSPSSTPPPPHASPDSASPDPGSRDLSIKDIWQEPGPEEPCQAPWRSLQDQQGRTPHVFCDVPAQDASPGILPPVSDCYCPPTSPAPVPHPTLTSEISCEAAAHILAGIRGHEDPGRALSALGCTGSEDCMISNTRLFQLMDEAG